MNGHSRFAYISGALSDMTEEERTALRSFYESIARVCNDLHLHAYVPHLVSDPAKNADLSPHDVDALDREAVTRSALVIAYVGRPSTGVGIEIEMAYHANKPVIILCEKQIVLSRRLSRLVRGSPAVIKEILFDDREEATVLLANFLRDAYLPTKRTDDRPKLLQS